MGRAAWLTVKRCGTAENEETKRQLRFLQGTLHLLQQQLGSFEASVKPLLPTEEAALLVRVNGCWSCVWQQAPRVLLPGLRVVTCVVVWLAARRSATVRCERSWGGRKKLGVLS